MRWVNIVTNNKLVLVFAFSLSLILGSGVVAGADWYVGPSNYSTIVNATAGDTVHFMAGTYNNTSSIVVNNPLTLISDTGDYRTSGVVFTGESWLHVNSSNVFVKGFRFENTTWEGQAKRQGHRESGALLIEPGNDNVRVEKNRFLNGAGGGIYSIAASASAPSSENVAIVDNYFYDLKHRAISFEQAENSLIEGNFINETDIEGIYLYNVSGTNVSNNMIYNTSHDGILIEYSNRTIVMGNLIYGADVATPDGSDIIEGAIQLRRGTEFTLILNNTINQSHDGIVICNVCNVSTRGHIDSSAPHSENNFIWGNRFYDNQGSYHLVAGWGPESVYAGYNYWGGPVPVFSFDPSTTHIFGPVHGKFTHYTSPDGVSPQFEPKFPPEAPAIANPHPSRYGPDRTVYFREGRYKDVGVDIRNPVNMIAGTNPRTRGDYRTSGVVFTGKSQVTIHHYNNANVSVRGFRFENVARGPYADIVIVSNPGLSNVRVEKNLFNNTAGSGLSVGSNSVNVSVVGNHFEGIGFNDNLTAERNKETAILFYSVNDSVIRDNVISRTTWTGINLHDVHNSVVDNNSIYRTSKNGIQIAASVESNVNITDNTIMYANNDRTRIGTESYRLRKNDLGDALRLENISTSSNNDSWIVRLRDPNVKAALSIDGSSKVRVENNVITNNHDGVIICPSDCAISNYSYHHNDHNGLYSGTDAVIRNNVIHSNAGNDGGDWSNKGKDLITGFDDRTVHAPYNYWGTNVPGSTIDGNVTYAPWLLVGGAVNERDSFDRDDIAEDATETFSTGSENGTIRSVELRVGESVENVTLVVAVADSKLGVVGDVPSSRRVYAYVEIESSINQSAVRNSTITFVVSKRWLDSNRIKRNTIQLLRFSNGRWTTLDTRFVSEVGDDLTFSAATPGFSVFAITGIRSRSSSSGGGSGGSSGGSAYIPAASTFPWLFVDKQAVNVVQRLNPGEPFAFNTSGRGVVATSITVEVNTAVRNAALIAASLKSRPSSVSANPEGTLYRYVGVGTDNLNSAYVDSIMTAFAVSKEWLDENNAGSENVVLFAYDKASSSWVNAGARMTGETDSEVLFEAGTKGSEIFAIVSQGERAAVPEEPEPEEPGTVAPPVDVGQGEVPAEPEAVTPEPETAAPDTGRGGGLSPLVVTVMVILAVGIAAFVFARYYKKKRA